MNAKKLEEWMGEDAIPISAIGGIAKSTFLEWKGFKILVTILAALLGPLDGVLFGLCIIIFLDSATGIWKALAKNTFSQIRMRGMFSKWLFYAILMIAANSAQLCSPILFWVRDGMAVFIFISELNSITRNLNCLGFKVPTLETLSETLKKFKGGG